ncbi:MAG: oxidoreductase [Deltaproteobacteria bacterium HGW-Deltaproteobacteria-15]|jgi:3-hydroxyisobutyrate dehydrogenase|nr:MAG: oxidoreductase [Deltaproteobacteria bacterium HGW-Deltaproteobacteria-15]
MNIGWIGTGIMGASMAGRLQAAGHALSVYNRTRSKAEALLGGTASWCDSPAEVASKAEIVFTIVGHPRDVEEVYLGGKGILSSKGVCRIVVDMTTSRPSLARIISEKAALLSIESLDAPVSGGDVGARNGTLAIMVGGRKAVFEEILPLFQLMGKNISFMGTAGAGQHTKMCNQILVAGTMVGICESLLYAVKLGLDQQSVFEIVAKGLAGSNLLNVFGPRISQGDFAPGFFIEHFIKDMGIALSEAEAAGLSLPGLAVVHQLYVAAKAQGRARSGTQALYLALKSINGMG